MDRNVNWTDNAKTTTQTNSGDSRYRTSQIWFNEMQDNCGGTGVEIIELDSGNSHTSSSQEEPYENIQNMSHMWSYISGDRLEDSYAADRQARNRRRLRNADDHDSLQSDCFHFNGEPDAVGLNQNFNSYTILNKDLEARSDNSSESFEDMEIDETGLQHAAFKREWNGENSCGEVVTFNSDLDGEKRMIWIYSFKNRGLLSNNDYELVNIPSRSDTLSSASPECIDQYNNTDRVAYGGRVPSPIPTTYIPRLNLSLAATLPNVTEISEPKSSTTSDRNKECNPIPQMPVNGWFTDKVVKTEAVSKDTSTSNVNWMALSPRERRRRSRNTATEVQNMGQLQPVAEIVSYSEVKSPTVEPLTEIPEDDANSKASLRIEERKNETKMEVISPVVGDRGDYNKFVHRPRIKFDKPCLSAPTPITEPIEKLDTHNWIAEHAIKPYHEPILFAKDCNQSVLSAVTKISAGDRLSARNMTFLVPSEWREYSLVGDSHISLQLSLGQASEAGRRGPLGSLLRRCASCFKCCKYRV